MESRFIAIPLKDSQEDEVIEISCDELPEGSEVLAILEAEEARLSSWIEVAIEYYRHQRIEPFLLILESAGSRAGLNYASVKSDQMRALDILAAHWMHCGFREKQKDKRQDFFSKATVLFNTADKILMYDSSHLTVRAWFYLYEKETRTNKLDLADQQFNYVVKTQPTNVLSLIGKAVISFNKKDAKLAVYYFRKALRQKRHSIAALRVGLGYSFSKLGQFDKARLAFERALELEDNSVSAMVGLAIILLNTMEPDNFNMAINLFGKAYDLMPDHPVVLVHLANHFFFKREYENVQQLAWHAMQSTESDAIKSEACYQLARLKHAQHQYESAFKYYYQSKNLNNGEHTLAFFGLGQLYIYRNELEEAIKCFEKVHERMPNNVETLKILGSLYAHVQISDPTLLNEARQKGRDILQKYLKIVPGDIEVLIDLAQLLEHCEPKKSLEMYEMAIELLETMENIGPQPEMLNNVGALHMQMGDYQKAKQCFEQARNRLTEMIETQERDEAERPQLLTIRYNLARCLEYLCESLEAEQMYKEILHECPNYTDCYMRLGCLTRDRGQIYESSVWFKNALQYDQASADAWTLIGNLHMSKNEWQPAQKKFEHILTKAGPKTSDAYSLIALGNVWLEQLMNPGRKKEDEKKYMDRALQMYQKALKIQPKNMLAANGIGCVLAFKKAFMDARDVFSQVREATSEYFDVWINIAHVYMEKEQYMAAVQMYFSAMKKFKHENDPNILHYLAKAYYKAGMLTESKEQLEKALLEANDNVQIKFNYAVVLKRSAKNIFKSVTKITSEMVKNAMDNLKCSERIFVFISKNEDLSLPGAKLLSRTICREEAQNCRDLLAQAKVKLETALMNDEDDRKLKEKQEKEKEELRKKYAEEIARKEEEERKKIEAAKALRSTFVEMTKDILKLPEVVEDKKRTGGGRGRRKGGDDGDEFVNDSSDNGNWKSGDEEGGENRERRKKDKKSRKRREKDGGGSDNDRKQDRKKKRKEDRERKMQEKLSAKQSAKIKSRAFLSSSESSDDDDKKGGNLDEDSDNEAPRNRVDEFESPPPPIIGSSDSDSSDEEEKKTKKKRRKTVMDSDNSSAGSENEEEGDAPIIGASDDDDDEGPSNKKSSDEDVPSKRKKKKMLSSGESDSDESD